MTESENRGVIGTATIQAKVEKVDVTGSMSIGLRQDWFCAEDKDVTIEVLSGISTAFTLINVNDKSGKRIASFKINMFDVVCSVVEEFNKGSFAESGTTQIGEESSGS